MNPLLLLLAVACFEICVLGLGWPLAALWTAFALIPVIELMKRLLFVFDTTTMVEYLSVKVIPDLLLLSAIGGVTAAALLDSKRRYLALVQPLDIAVGLLILWNFFSVLNPSRPLLIGLAGFQYTGIPILYYIVGRTIFWQPARFRNLLRLTLFMGMITGAYGWYHIAYGMTEFEYTWLESGLTSLRPAFIYVSGLLRIFSSFQSHGEFAAYLVVALFALYLLRDSLSSPIKVLALAVMVVPLVHTFARDGWVVFFGAILIAWWVRHPRLLRHAPIIGILVAPALIGVFGNWVWAGGLGALIPQDSSLAAAAMGSGTYGARVLGWQNAIQNPDVYFSLVGQGIGAIFAGARLGAQAYENPHNGVLEIALENGLVGLVIFYVVIFGLWRVSLRAIDTVPAGQAEQAVVLVGLCAGVLLSNALIGNYLARRPAAIYFWLSLGVLHSWAISHVHAHSKLLKAKRKGAPSPVPHAPDEQQVSA